MSSFNLADLFEILVDSCPERTALVAGEVRYTYAELDARANRIAHAFIADGLVPGDHIGVYARNRAEWLEAMIGAFKARIVPVNINFRYVEDELRYIVDNADLKALVVERSYLPLVAAVGFTDVAYVLEDGSSAENTGTLYEEALARSSENRDFQPRSSDDRYMVYTGGTTGFPKGVEWRHEDLFKAALGGGNLTGPPIEKPEEIGVHGQTPSAVQVLTSPLMHGNGQWVTWIALLGACTAVMWTGQRYDAAEILRTVERERGNYIMLVGDAMARPLADELAKNTYDVSSLKVIGSGGALLSPTVKQQLRDLIPGVYIVDGFGASEFGAGGAQNADGRFVLKASMAVLGDDLRPVGPGETGMMARSGHIPLGYYKDPVKTAATFVTDETGVRWSIPGDFARVEADGTATLLGRGSVCINTGGEKVYPEEVEGVLKSHPAVYDALVVGVPDERFGEKVAAVVALRAGFEVTLDELTAHARTHIAGYKIPRSLHVVEEIPRNPAGKPSYVWAKKVATG